jgi:hypothetical protein
MEREAATDTEATTAEAGAACPTGHHLSTGVQVLFGLGAALMIVAGGCLATLSWAPGWIENEMEILAGSAVAGMALGMLAMAVGGMRAMARARGRVEPFAPYIFGLGVMLNGFGGVGIVGAAGLIHHGQLYEKAAELAASGAEDAQAQVASLRSAAVMANERRASSVLLAGGMAFIGSFLYTALALWRKQRGKSDEEAFDVGQLLAGGALRSGEALLFTLVFVLLTQVEPDGEFDAWLPVAGLMVGMFVKSGERVVFNLAQRIFAVAQAIVPAPGGAPTAAAPPGEGAEAPPKSARTARDEEPPAADDERAAAEPVVLDEVRSKRDQGGASGA